MAVDIVRAWKDPEYRKTLTSEELAALPENPAFPFAILGACLLRPGTGSSPRNCPIASAPA